MFHDRCSPWLATLAFLAACSDSPTTNPPPGGNSDASVTTGDASSSGNPDASATGNPDASTTGNPDASAMGNPDATSMGGACNAVTGGGCPNMGEVCYYVAASMGLSCRLPIGMPLKQFGEACVLGQQDCEAGLSCVSLQGGPGPICIKSCAVDNDCAGLMGAPNGFVCNVTLQGDAKFCGPRLTSCDPAMRDACPMNETCELTQQGPACSPAGMVAKGGACTSLGQCAHGLACLNFGSGGHCEEMCNPMGGSCSSMGENCAGFQTMAGGPTYGFCQPGCDVYAQDCPNNQNCSLVSQTAVGCIPSGNVAVGGTCGQGMACVKGAHCLNLGMGFKCFAPCDMTHACAMGQCAMTNPPLPWGGLCN